MLRLTKKMEDGKYQANCCPVLPGENSYAYKNMIIERCGMLEDTYTLIEELKEKAKKVVNSNRKCEKVINQDIYILEEMTELSKEILKDRRKKGDINRIKEEMSDVLCTLLTYAYDKNIDVDELIPMAIQKYDRGIARLQSGEQ